MIFIIQINGKDLKGYNQIGLLRWFTASQKGIRSAISLPPQSSLVWGHNHSQVPHSSGETAILGAFEQEVDALIFKHYSWTSFPQLKQNAWLDSKIGFISFVNGFEGLMGVHLLETPSELLTKKNIPLLAQAQSLGALTIQNNANIPLNNQCLLS